MLYLSGNVSGFVLSFGSLFILWKCSVILDFVDTRERAINGRYFVVSCAFDQIICYCSSCFLRLNLLSRFIFYIRLCSFGVFNYAVVFYFDGSMLNGGWPTLNSSGVVMVIMNLIGIVFRGRRGRG